MLSIYGFLKVLAGSISQEARRNIVRRNLFEIYQASGVGEPEHETKAVQLLNEPFFQTTSVLSFVLASSWLGISRTKGLLLNATYANFVAGNTQYEVSEYRIELNGWQNMWEDASVMGEPYQVTRWVEGGPLYCWVYRQKESLPYTITGGSFLVFQQPLKLKDYMSEWTAFSRRFTFFFSDGKHRYGLLKHA